MILCVTLVYQCYFAGGADIAFYVGDRWEARTGVVGQFDVEAALRRHLAR